MYPPRKLFLFPLVLLALACSETPQEQPSSAAPQPEATAHSAAAPTELVLRSDLQWEALNPARGDQSPRAANLWGDRQGTEATGFLVQFVDGFSSPPHLHNVSYRALVLGGEIHNDDPAAAQLWMPPGSFWTQPAGEVHITSARGTDNVAYVEIDRGPYLVQPVEEAFVNGEYPINVHADNLVWLDATSSDFLASSTTISRPEKAPLWASDRLRGLLLRLPVGFAGDLTSEGDEFRAVLIKGRLAYGQAATPEAPALLPGSYFGSRGTARHSLRVEGEAEVQLYLRTNGRVDLK
ncbi:MAG: DUF4437 domain-containing protein [Bacteroidota bacterium]